MLTCIVSVVPVHPRPVDVLGLPVGDRPPEVHLLVAAVRIVVLSDGHLDGPHTVADEVHHGVVGALRHGHAVDADQEVARPQAGLLGRAAGHDAGQNAGLLAGYGEAEPVGAPGHLRGADPVAGPLLLPAPARVHRAPGLPH